MTSPRITSLAWATIFITLAGCAHLAGRPRPIEDWPRNQRPAAERLPPIVAIYQSVGWLSIQVGSGAIIHSCPEHGTFILTAWHVVDEPEEQTFVWLYDDQRTTPDPDAIHHKGALRCYSAEVVIPQIDQALLEERKAAQDFANLVRIILDDFALLKLNTRRTFPTLPIYQGERRTFLAGEQVIALPLQPEGYPHRHAFKWSNESLPEAIAQEGHSGCALLLEGKLFAILSKKHDLDGKVSESVYPSIAAMREDFDDLGYAFVLGPNCPR